MFNRVRRFVLTQFDLRLFRVRPAEAYPVTLVQRRIFVLPTRAGLVFCATLVAMLLASINYSLNLGFALTFLLAGVGLTSTFHAYRNLLELEISSGHDQRAHLGQRIRYELKLVDHGQRPRLGLHVRTSGASAQTELEKGETRHVALEHAASHRGLNPIGRITIETRYPLGLVRAWSVLTPAHEVLVYPAIAPEAPPPPDTPTLSPEPRQDSSREGNDDFTGLRTYRDSDSPRQIAWKAVARSDTLISKSFSNDTGAQLSFKWDELPLTLDTEARLSRLTRWVVDAAAVGAQYELQLPGQHIGPGNDAAHRERCLQALAMFGVPDA